MPTVRLIALLAAAVLVPAAAAHAAPKDCTPKRGEKVVVRSDEAVVLSDRKGRKTVFASCAVATGKRKGLGTASSGARRDRRVGPFAVAGPFVAWGTTSSDGGRSEGADLHVRDARRPGRTRDAILPSDLPLREVVVDASGRAAALTEIEAFVLDGEVLRRVDVGARGVLADLRLDGEDATWSHAGQPQRAPLTLPLAPCAPEQGAYGAVNGPRAVLAKRTSGLASSSRVEVIACVREGDGVGSFFAIGEERGELAGTIAAALLPRPGGGGDDYDIGVVDLTTRGSIGARIPIARDFDPWALAADGTVVTLEGDRLVAHLPDGRALPVASNASGTRFVLVDDVLRTVVWDRGSAPLP